MPRNLPFHKRRSRTEMIRQAQALIKLAIESDDIKTGLTCVSLAAALGWASKTTSEPNILLCVSSLAEFVQEQKSKRVEVVKPQIIIAR